MNSEIAAIQDAKRRSVLVYLLSADEDQEVSKEISKHLKPIIRDFPAKIELDSDFDILGGADREQHKKQLFEADIVLALMSSDFISDDDVYDRTKRVIERHNTKQTVIIPLLVRNCMWKTTPFAGLGVLPTNYQPLNNKQFWNSPDDALVAVVTDIHSSLNKLVQSGGVQLSSTDAAKPQPDPEFTSETAENQTALLHSTPQEGVQSTTEQRVLSAKEKTFDIRGITEVPGGAAEVGSPISVDWRKKHNRFVVLKRGAALLIDQVMGIIMAVIVGGVARGAVAAFGLDTEDEIWTGVFGLGVTLFIICPMMESSRWYGTFGKIIMRIQITDRDGNRITFWRAFLRNVTRILVFYIYVIPLVFIWQIVRFRKTKKLFHDEWSGTVIGERLARVKTPRLAVSGEADPADKKGALLTGLKPSRMRARLEAHPQDLTTQERDFGQATMPPSASGDLANTGEHKAAALELPAPSSSIVPATSEKTSPAPDRVQSPAARQSATQDGPQTAVAAPAVQPSGEKASPAPREPAQSLVAREAAPQSSPEPPVREASAKESSAPAPIFGKPGDNREHKPATPEPRGEAEFAAPTALSAPGVPPASKKMASAPPSASGDLANTGEHKAATLELPAPSSSIVPATSEKTSPAPDRVQSPAAQQSATQDAPQTAVAAPAVQPSGEKASPAPREPAQSLVAREAAPQSSPEPPVREASAKESSAPAPIFGKPGDNREDKPATPEPRGEAEFAAPTALSAPGVPPASKKMASAEHADAEDRRKARQRRIITRASIAAAVVLACFAIAAGVAWNQAEENAKQADVAKVEAENQTQLANKAREQADEVAKQAEFERNEAIAALCLRVGRDLTKADLAHYVGDTPWQPSCGAFGVPSNWQRQPADYAESDAAALDDAPTKTQPAAPPASPVLRVTSASADVSPAPPEPAQPLVANAETLHDSAETAAPTALLEAGEAKPAAPTAASASGLSPITKKASPAAPSASGDLADIGEHKAATLEGPKDPRPRQPQRSQHVAHTAPHGNMPTPTGNTTSQLNQQELARQKSVASMPDNIISGFFRSLFR
jgi:uncharacterized RDD family membrane protein YckC